MKRLVLVVYGSLLLVQLVHADSSGTVSLPWAKTGVSYNVQLVATVSGSSPFVFDLHAGDHLPPTFSLSTSGLLTGAPAAGAVQTAYTFTVDVKDATGSIAQSQPVSLTVSPSPQAVSLSVTSSENKLPWAVPGHSYEVQLSTTVSGQTPFTFELSAGSAPLPAGLTLDSDGTLKTANTGAANNYVFIVSVRCYGQDSAIDDPVYFYSVGLPPADQPVFRHLSQRDHHQVLATTQRWCHNCYGTWEAFNENRDRICPIAVLSESIQDLRSRHRNPADAHW